MRSLLDFEMGEILIALYILLTCNTGLVIANSVILTLTRAFIHPLTHPLFHSSCVPSSSLKSCRLAMLYCICLFAYVRIVFLVLFCAAWEVIDVNCLLVSQFLIIKYESSLWLGNFLFRRMHRTVFLMDCCMCFKQA
jgi:hypothetical protein